MKKKNSIIFIPIILFLNFTANCQTLNKNFFMERYTLYEKSKQELKKDHFDNAVSILEKIKKNNVIHFKNDKIQINLIYAYYKNLNFNMAQKNIEEFISLYPNHKNMDYITYMQCLILISLDKNIFFKILPIYNNDLRYAKNAFFKLKDFIYKYPKSLYIINAKKDLIYLKNRLSQNELQILKFYFFRQEYIAVVNRGEEILQKYSETPAARIALIFLKKSYDALKIFDTSKKISEIILLNKKQEN